MQWGKWQHKSQENKEMHAASVYSIGKCTQLESKWQYITNIQKYVYQYTANLTSQYILFENTRMDWLSSSEPSIAIGGVVS